MDNSNLEKSIFWTVPFFDLLNHKLQQLYVAKNWRVFQRGLLLELVIIFRFSASSDKSSSSLLAPKKGSFFWKWASF